MACAINYAYQTEQPLSEDYYFDYSLYHGGHDPTEFSQSNESQDYFEEFKDNFSETYSAGGDGLPNREKARLNNINQAFDSLRQVIPTFPYEKRLTKIETLKLAICYINMLQHLLSSPLTPAEFIQRTLAGEHVAEGWHTLELSARLTWLDWTRLGL